jgi:hypothetical protein
MVQEPSGPGRLIALACAAALALAGCGQARGHGAAGEAVVAWAGNPAVVRQPELPRDRIAVGRVRNLSGRELRLNASSVRVVDEAGRPLRSSVRFASAYGHGLYSYEQQPREGDPEFERRRLGELAVIEPGKTAPLTVSWRLPADGVHAVRVRVGDVTLTLPNPR